MKNSIFKIFKILLFIFIIIYIVQLLFFLPNKIEIKSDETSVIPISKFD